MAPLIQKLAATSIAEIERLIAELREAKDHLQSERERIEREMVRYMRLTEMASTTAKIISDAVSQWHPAGNPQKSTPFKATASSTKVGSGHNIFDTTPEVSRLSNNPLSGNT